MVSVFLLSWNHEKYIVKAIESITAQSYKDIEILYVDNNSTDQSYEIATRTLIESGVKYSAYKRDRNYGIAANHNYAFTHSSGEFFCPLSADDWLHKDSILMKHRELIKNPDAGMVYSGGYKYYDKIDIYEPFNVITFPSSTAKQELLKQNFISGIGCLIRRRVIQDVGLWNETYEIEDGDMWVRIISKYRIIGIPDYLFFYRQHPSSFTSDPERTLRAKMEWLHSNKSMNKSPALTLRNNIESYLSVKVMQETSLKVLLKVIRHFRFKKHFLSLLLKAILPVKTKQSLRTRSLLRRFRNVRPE